MGLVRKVPLKVDPAKVRDWVDRSRRRLPPRSRKVEADQARRAEVRAQVLGPGARCCLDRRDRPTPIAHMIPLCYGPLTPHHVRKASQGGAYDVGNLVPCCTFHQVWIEDNPALAHFLGVVERAGDA